MKEKKNIEDLFREKFSQLDKEPSPRVWENIQHELHPEKKRRVVPLWIQLGGVAAFLALLFTLGNLWFSPSDVINQPLPVFTNDAPKSPVDTAPEINDQNTTDAIVSGNSSEQTTLSSSKITGNSVANSERKSTTKKSGNSQDLLVQKRNFNKNQPESVASISNSANKKLENESIGISDNDALVAKETKVANTFKNDAEVNNHNENLIVGNLKTNSEGKTEIVRPQTDEKHSLFDAIAEQEKLKGEDPDAVPTQGKRWAITPNVAPVYYNSLSKGSSIDPNLNMLPNNGDVNMSYGVQVSYLVNNRLNIRAGINSVDLSYTTSDLLIATGPASRGLKGVNYGSKEVVVTALRKNGSQNLDGLNLKSGSADARLVQAINYIEVPVEVSYKLVDSRFGLNLIGGMSTLFLGRNDISIKSPNFNASLGSANNLSDVSFTTNVGLGMNYRLSRRFIFNIEPMFKYQLNPYSDSSIDFRPYYLGIYSGLSFRF